MIIVHVVTAQPGIPGGREIHVQRFVRLSEQNGVRSVVLPEENLDKKGVNDIRAYLAKLDAEHPDVVLIHGRRGWARIQTLATVGPSIAWVHDQSFVCPASISWFRRTRQPCSLPLGLHCVTNAYLRHCNARRPDRNIANVLSVSRNRRSVRQLRGIIVASEYMRNRLQIGGVPEGLINVLPYFVETPSIPMAVPQSRRILFVGRLEESKGVDVLIDAMCMLPDFELTIAGDGYQRAHLEERTQRLGISTRVRFAGFVSDSDELKALYLASAALAIPSLWPEPFCIAGLEALAHGVPTVGSRVGGIPEWLEDGKVGLLAQPGSASDLAEKLARVLAMDRAHLAARARRHVEQHFSWANHWERFLTILARQI